MSAPPKLPMCVRCRFYQPSKSFQSHGECRACPPQPLGPFYGGYGREGQWPMVQDADWCGEFKIKPLKTNSCGEKT
jgi:hypothetical protein